MVLDPARRYSHIGIYRLPVEMPFDEGRACCTRSSASKTVSRLLSKHARNLKANPVFQVDIQLYFVNTPG